MLAQKFDKASRLYQPILPRPEVDQIVNDNESWTKKIGICYDDADYRKFLRIDYGGVAAMAYKNETPAITQFGADLISWLFLFDDRFGEGPEFQSRDEMNACFASFVTLPTSLEEPANPTPFHNVLLHLMERAKLLGPAGWLELFQDSLIRYTDGCKGEYQLRYENHNPTIAEYTAIRRGSIGTYPVLDVIDLNFSQVMARIDPIPYARDITADLLGWVNDIYSYRKETEDNDPCNLVTVIAHDLNISQSQAFDHAIAMQDKRLEEFYELYKSALADATIPFDVKRYLDSLRNWIWANHVWASTTNRYHW